MVYNVPPVHKNVWQILAEKKPIIGLSPMDGVTDQPYRHIQKKYGKPDVMYTEFTSVEGVCHNAEKLLDDFLFDESQRPIIAQIYGTTPKFFRQTAVLLCQLGFDGIDINMGCPAKNVAHSGAGAALIRTPQLAQKIIQETKAGVTDWLNGMTERDCPDISERIAQQVASRHAALPIEYQQKRPIPVSVKTRIGYDQPVVETWITTLLEMEPSAIAVHGRTLKQQYSGYANWDAIGTACQVAQHTPTLILGNGDIDTLTTATEKTSIYGLDGVLIGRASFGNPFVFQPSQASQHNLFAISLEHARFFETTYGTHPRYNFLPMRKHLGWYVKTIPGAKELRIDIFKTQNSQEVEQLYASRGLV